MRFVLLTLLALLFASCSATQQVDGSEKSGFLQNYSMLKAGDDEQAAKRYIREGVKWERYKKVIIRPIEIWAKTDSDLRDMDNKDLEDLLSLLHATVSKQLAHNFKIVKQPGPDTLTIRIALTEGVESHPIRDTLSNVLPYGLIITYVKKAFTGVHNHVGIASIELEIANSMNNERLAAAMDRRAGKKTLDSSFSKWDDIQDAFDYWSEQMSERLNDLGAGTGLED